MIELKRRFYKIIRPLFVLNIDPNEDFECGWCKEPLLRRVLFCSSECSFLSEREALGEFKSCDLC